MDPITFNATLPNIQSAISFGADEVRVKLDIPRTDKAAALRLADEGPDRVLKVTVEVVEDNGI